MTVLLKMQRACTAQKLRLTAAADLAAADLLHTHYNDGGNVFILRYFYNQNGSTLVFEHDGEFVAVPYRIFSDRWREYLHNQCAPQTSNLSTYRAEHQTVSLPVVDADDLWFTAEQTLVLMGYLCEAGRNKIIEGH